MWPWDLTEGWHRQQLFIFSFFKIQTDFYQEIIIQYIVNFKYAFHLSSFWSLIYLHLTFPAKLPARALHALHEAGLCFSTHPKLLSDQPSIFKSPCHSFSAAGITVPSWVNCHFCFLSHLSTKPLTRVQEDHTVKVLKKWEVLYDIRWYHLSQLPSCWRHFQHGLPTQSTWLTTNDALSDLGKSLYLSVCVSVSACNMRIAHDTTQALVKMQRLNTHKAPRTVPGTYSALRTC